MIRKIKEKFKNSTTVWTLYSIYKRYSLRKSKMGYCGKGVVIQYPISVQNPKHLFLYDDTNIYGDSMILNTNANFVMKMKSGAAQGLKVICGSHLSSVGTFFKDISETNKIILNGGDMHKTDKDIIVEEDVWIATNVTLLSGIIVGRGCVVGSGAVLRHSTPPYSICIGNPAKVVGFKFTPEEIIKHEIKLYPEEERLPIELLEKNYNKYFINRISEIKKYTRL